MALEVSIVVTSPSSTFTLSGQGGAVTILPAATTATVSPHVSQATILPEGSRIVRLAMGAPGSDGADGADGTGLAWVSLTTEEYEALGTPDPDTIYDLTDALTS